MGATHNRCDKLFIRLKFLTPVDLIYKNQFWRGCARRASLFDRSLTDLTDSAINGCLKATRLSPSLSALRSCVTRLLLTADGEHKHRIKLCNISIQRDIATCTAPDHKFSEIRSRGPTDQRIAFQYIDCFYDVFNMRWRIGPLMRKEMFQDAIEIVPDLWRELDARHD